MNQNFKFVLFTLGILLCTTPYVSSPVALIIGLGFATFGFVPATVPLSKITKKLLSYSIVGLGFGIPLHKALSVTSHGLGLIMTSIFCTLLIGFFISVRVGLAKKTGYLIASGTAICGGSAIAAVGPAIKADDDQMALALGAVFVLNSIALFAFPMIGHALNMDQQMFGTWAAIAIHDTSSVVGAASAYGEEALKTATTLKLARALWIVPVSFLSTFMFRNESKKITIPYFILFYCLVVYFHEALPQFQALYHVIFAIAKHMLVICLFLIGCSLTFNRIRAAGAKPLLFGTGLWVTISVSSLYWIMHHSA
ncbi:putative sulfate exporter family transporter [Vibrio albus]|uniref:Putative sulfate exporter family transporter n=1 Tax=Vibrio albus TaxID=2200953 RepID=A0A2U3BAK2_9VIBR|nr:putative sulfate exporter family transporter [Vibrio albus]PWI33820.1 putative sulfate exporter family transporter [Vibrio albus]